VKREILKTAVVSAIHQSCDIIYKTEDLTSANVCLKCHFKKVRIRVF